MRATGAEVKWFREAMATPLREDVFWAARDYAEGVEQVTTPVQLVGGWYDILLPWMLEDFAALQAAGREPQLIVGAWAHTSPGLVAAGMREALGWLRAHLLDDDRLVRPDAVRVQITGERTRRGRLALAGELAAARHRRAAAVGRRRRAAARAASRPARPAAPTATATTRPTRRRRSAGRCCSPATRSSTTRRSRRAPTS